MPNIWADPVFKACKRELKEGAMYNFLYGALLGSYRGPVTAENFWKWAKEPDKDAEHNFATMFLSFADENNYRIGTCGLISPDTMELGLQTGLYQAPHVTVIDRRYELTGACRTKVVDGNSLGVFNALILR